MSRNKPNREAEQLVQAAQLTLAAKEAELKLAHEAVRILQSQVGQAIADVRAARLVADQQLPQCRLVSIGWQSSRETDSGVAAVILRKTPTGILVVRRVGESKGAEYKFKWASHNGCYRQAEKVSFSSSTRVLRDVPPEFMPQAEELKP